VIRTLCDQCHLEHQCGLAFGHWPPWFALSVTVLTLFGRSSFFFPIRGGVAGWAVRGGILVSWRLGNSKYQPPRLNSIPVLVHPVFFLGGGWGWFGFAWESGPVGSPRGKTSPVMIGCGRRFAPYPQPL
jgi:hypothetical protein